MRPDTHTIVTGAPGPRVQEEDLSKALAWQHVKTIVSAVHTVLRPGVPRHTQELYKEVWLRLNTVYPRQLWLLTVNCLTPPPTITQVWTLLYIVLLFYCTGGPSPGPPGSITL